MPDAFLLIIRWVHIIAAVTWVGGGIFYFVVLRPALRTDGVPLSVRQFIGTEFGQLVMLSMWALAITGGILAFTRLADQAATMAYGAILAIKVVLSAWMFFIAISQRRRRASPPQHQSGMRARLALLGHVNMTVVLGLIVFFLSGILQYIIEQG